jgi:cytochrome c oxidase subunit 1
MHGSIMLFLFVGPFAFGLANYFVPLHAGARDMAFPRLNLISYWLYLGGGLVMCSSFLTSEGAAAFGWFAYTPLSNSVRSPGLGGDLWIAGVALTGLSGVLTSVNIITTVTTMRAKGMTMFRLPIFTWNMVVTSVLVLIAFPVLTAAAAMLYTDRHLGGHIFDPSNGGDPVLWQHLFWFFGHPEVYILILPYFGVITEVIAVFSRRPVFGYKGIVFATLAIAGLSIGVWAHHMYPTGVVFLPFFAGLTMLIAVPTGVKFFNWIGTMWGGSIRFNAPMLFSLGFLLSFLIGGLTGPILASPPLDFHLHDSYFVVAHFHYVLMGGSVFGIYAAIYYWFPKVTGRRLNEGLARVHFVLMFVGFQLTFFVQHLLGLEGMPRRVADYTEADGFTGLNQISTIGAMLLGASTLPFLWNLWRTMRRPPDAGDNPWDGHTLEWATTSPPPPHNFDALPPIRSERPVWDVTHPESRPTEEPDPVDPDEENVREPAR